MRKVEEKARALSEKSGLKQPPKPRIIRGITGVNSNTNILSISKDMLSQWQNGEISESDVDGTLAHEFGHLIEHSTDRLGRKSDRQAALYLFALPLALLLYYALLIPEPGVGYPVITLIWVAFLPFMLRKIYLPGELAADRNAIKFSLISDEEMATCIVRIRTGKIPNESLGPMEILKAIENWVTHPFLAEQLANIGFEIEKPVKVKRLNR